MNIIVKTLEGINHIIKVNEANSIYDLKCLIKDRTGIAICDQSLVYAGHELNNNAIISDIGLNMHTCIYLVKKDRKKIKNDKDLIEQLQIQVLMLEDRVQKLEDEKNSSTNKETMTDELEAQATTEREPYWSGGEIKDVVLRAVTDTHFLTSVGNIVYVWSTQTGKIENRFVFNNKYNIMKLDIAITYDGKYLVIGHNKGVDIINISENNVHKTIEMKDIEAIRTSEKYLKLYTENCNWYLYSVDTFELIEKSNKKSYIVGVKSKMFTDNYEFYVMYDHIKQIHKKTLKTHIMKGHYDDRFDKNGSRCKGGLHSIDVTPDEKYVITGGTDDRAIIWQDGAIKHVISFDLDGGTYTGIENKHEAPWFVRVTKDSKYMIAATMDGWVRCFNVETGFICKAIKMSKELPDKMYVNDKFLFVCYMEDMKVIPLSEFGL